jgi:hypothetical protein
MEVPFAGDHPTIWNKRNHLIGYTVAKAVDMTTTEVFTTAA